MIKITNVLIMIFVFSFDNSKWGRIGLALLDGNFFSILPMGFNKKYSILKKVYDRGMAAWRGGHRPGTTQVQWALARVNSFVTKSSGTWGWC